jgi:ABC-type branched-subunit amino acid transport system permease subunit
VAYAVVHSRLGLELQAIRDDEDAANASGINPAKYKMIVFIISSFLAGVAGGVYTYSVGNLRVPQQFGMDWTIGAIVSVTIGGWGTLIGPILGSIVFVIPRELLQHTVVGDWYLVVTGAIFILVILFLPDGLTSLGAVARRLFASRTRKSTASLSRAVEKP